jgi:hypothetical protein
MNDWTRVVAATVATWAAASAGAGADLPAHLGVPPGPGIWCRRVSPHPVPRDHEERLAQSLRRITGLAGLRFQPDGCRAEPCPASRVMAGFRVGDLAGLATGGT